MPDLEWLTMRAEAETETCPQCHSAPGRTCTRRDPLTNERAPLQHLPAHEPRTRAARNTQAINQGART